MLLKKKRVFWRIGDSQKTIIKNNVYCSNQVISLRGKDENECKCTKMKNARAKRAKLLFFIIKYANLRRSYRRRSLGLSGSVQ